MISDLQKSTTLWSVLQLLHWTIFFSIFPLFLSIFEYTVNLWYTGGSIFLNCGKIQWHSMRCLIPCIQNLYFLETGRVPWLGIAIEKRARRQAWKPLDKRNHQPSKLDSCGLVTEGASACAGKLGDTTLMKPWRCTRPPVWSPASCDKRPW